MPLKRLNTIAKEATEQSRRLSKPIITEPISLIQKLQKFDFEKRTLIYLDERPIDNNTTEILKKFKAKVIDVIEYKLPLEEVFERNLVIIKYV